MARPTRQGISTIVVGLISAGVGRVFGIVELYIIAAALFLLPLGSWLVIMLRPTRLAVVRRIHPRMVEAGSDGAVRVDVYNQAQAPSPVVTVHEPIGPSNTANIELDRLRGHDSIAAVYHIPTERRGVVVVGPMTMTRRDPFRLARTSKRLAPSEDLLVTPRILALSPPSDASGPLGAHLRSIAQRLGRGDFHSLRDYVAGDELRSIHWKASARTDELKVKQHDRQALERCTVILDTRGSSYVDDYDPAEAFERAVTCAASIIGAAQQGELNTRFVAGPTVDHRGPDVLADALASLASITMTSDDGTIGPDGQADMVSTSEWRPIVTDPSDGLGLVVVISGSRSYAADLLPRRLDPGTSEVTVGTTQGGEAWNSVEATSLTKFQTTWDVLVGHSTSARPSSYRVTSAPPPTQPDPQGITPTPSDPAPTGAFTR